MKKYVTIISTFLLVSCTVGGQLSQLKGPDDLKGLYIERVLKVKRVMLFST